MTTTPPSTARKRHRLRDILVREVSLVSRAANKRRWLLTKGDDDSDVQAAVDAALAEAEAADRVEKAIAAGDDDALVAAVEGLPPEWRTLLARACRGEIGADVLDRAHPMLRRLHAQIARLLGLPVADWDKLARNMRVAGLLAKDDHYEENAMPDDGGLVYLEKWLRPEGEAARVVAVEKSIGAQETLALWARGKRGARKLYARQQWPGDPVRVAKFLRSDPEHAVAMELELSPFAQMAPTDALARMRGYDDYARRLVDRLVRGL